MSAPNKDATGLRVPAGASPGEDPTGSMIWIPGGDFIMGSNRFYREERPARAEAVGGFWIDPHPVTNAEFRRFVLATGYLTLSERAPDPAMYPDADPSLLAPGSLVFTKPDGPVDLRDYRSWWAYVPGANWRRPEGPASNIDDRWDHPVVHVAFDDVVAYAAWAGKAIPTEAEWEFAARGDYRARHTPGVKNSLRTGERWRTPGRVGFPGRILPKTATKALRRSARSPPTAMGFTT